MIRHRYYVGTVTKDGADVSATATRKIHHSLVEIYGGYTEYAGMGAWRDETGYLKEEPCLVYEALSPTRVTEPGNLAALLATVAEQTTVLWTEEEVRGGFSQ